MAKHMSLIGCRFGRLVVIKLASIDDRYRTRWHCRCDCGNRHAVDASHLTRGAIRSCGCLRKETTRDLGKANWRHGRSKTREFASWKAMHERCRNPNHHAYARYGGCGIKVCKRWDEFKAFFADMGPRPKGTSIDRYPDPYGDYKPSNCRWATPAMQQKNHRNSPVTTVKVTAR